MNILNDPRCLPAVLVLALAPVACSTEAEPAPQATEAAAKLVLSQDPGDAFGVVAARQKTVGERMTVQGRVHEMTKGFAMFVLMDESLEYCGQVDKSDKCETPWDYCCESKDTLASSRLLVEFRGEDGRPLPTPVVPETRLTDLLKVTGTLTEDEHGSIVLVADGLFRVERPNLPDYVHWPQPL